MVWGFVNFLLPYFSPLPFYREFQFPAFPFRLSTSHCILGTVRGVPKEGRRACIMHASCIISFYVVMVHASTAQRQRQANIVQDELTQCKVNDAHTKKDVTVYGLIITRPCLGAWMGYSLAPLLSVSLSLYLHDTLYEYTLHQNSILLQTPLYFSNL